MECPKHSASVISAKVHMHTSIFVRFGMTACLLCLVGCGTTHERASLKPAIAVTIPYGSHDSLAPFPPCSRHDNSFYILLTNVSKRPVRVWQEWCSWGYYSLQFEVFGKDGKRHLLKKKLTSFYANFPDYVELLPRGSVVWRVELFPPLWEDLSWLTTNRAEHVTLRAIYSVTADEDSKQYGIWAGHTSSGVYDFILFSPRTHDIN